MPGAGDKLLLCSSRKVADAQDFPGLIPGNGLPAKLQGPIIKTLPHQWSVRQKLSEQPTNLPA